MVDLRSAASGSQPAAAPAARDTWPGLPPSPYTDLFKVDAEEFSNQSNQTEVPDVPRLRNQEKLGIFSLSKKYLDQLRADLASTIFPAWNQAYLAETWHLTTDGRFMYDRDTDSWLAWESKSLRTWTVIPDVTMYVRIWLAWLLGAPDIDLTNDGRRRVLSKANLDAVASLADVHGDPPHGWHPNPALIGLPGGYGLDTTTGDIGPLEKTDYVRNFLPDGVLGDEGLAGLDQEDGPPVWSRFLDEMLGDYDERDRVEVRRFLKMYCGAALAGRPETDEAAVFFYGPPGSGKSTFGETIKACFGDVLGVNVKGERLVRDDSQHLQWLARLRGKRLVLASELPGRGRWRTDTLDALISGESLEANMMRENSVDFRSTVRLILTGNHKPAASGGSGIWRRLKFIRCRHEPMEVDRHLKAKLRAELPGIFAWVYAGLLEWLNNSEVLDTPVVIDSDTESNRVESDPFLSYVDERLIFVPEARLYNEDLEHDFAAWWQTNGSGLKPSGRTLGRRFNELGLPPTQRTSGGLKRFREGVGLLADGGPELPA